VTCGGCCGRRCQANPGSDLAVSRTCVFALRQKLTVVTHQDADKSTTPKETTKQHPKQEKDLIPQIRTPEKSGEPGVAALRYS
jgi:hypothetical protein